MTEKEKKAARIVGVLFITATVAGFISGDSIRDPGDK
jgi:hypothetical protein